MGITLLEMSEATAVGIALFAESKKAAVFIAVILGVLVIFVPTAFIGKYITLLPIFYVRLISAVLLLYFGIRLIRSSRRSVKFSLGIKAPHKESRYCYLHVCLFYLPDLAVKDKPCNYYEDRPKNEACYGFKVAVWIESNENYRSLKCFYGTD